MSNLIIIFDLSLLSQSLNLLATFEPQIQCQCQISIPSLLLNKIILLRHLSTTICKVFKQRIKKLICSEKFSIFNLYLNEV